MRVVHNSYVRLVLWDRPILLTGLCSLMAGVIGLVAITNPDQLGLIERLIELVIATGLIWMIWAKLPFQRFVFDRASGRIYRTRWKLWQRIDDYMPIERLASIRQRADLIGNGSATYYIALQYVSRDGEIKEEPLSASSTGREHTKTIHILNEWLTRPNKTPV